MNLVLSSEAMEVIHEKVASGEFATPEAVIDAAVRQLRVNEQQYGEWLRAAVRQGEESVEEHGSIPVTPEFWARLKRPYQH